ncbi:MAG: DNA polymerase III subunit delta' [Hyphomonadaceae bacterium]
MNAPSATFSFVGHEAAEGELAAALGGARLHHAWLICGPRGVGKATLAFRAARVALGAKRVGPRPLDVAPDDPIARQIAAGSHPDFFLVERGLNERGKRRRDISAEEARALPGFFSLASASGGMRVAIVDAVDDLNRFSANALLKILEEPPPRTLLMLVCHAPGAALATIRSRCRRLDLRALSEPEMGQVIEADAEIVRLAAGRPGRAAAFLAQGDLAGALSEALARLERQGGRSLLPIAMTRGGDAEERLALVLDAVEDWVRRAAARVDAPSSRAAAWAEAYSDLETLRGEADGLDMDPTHALARAALIVDRALGARA